MPGRSYSFACHAPKENSPTALPTVFPAQLPVCCFSPVSALKTVLFPVLGLPAKAIRRRVFSGILHPLLHKNTRGIGIAQSNQRILHPIHSCAAACTFIQRQNPTVSEKAQIKQTQIAFSPYLLHEARTFHRNFRQLLGHIHSSFNGLIYSIYPKEAVRVLVKGILLIVNHFIFYH